MTQNIILGLLISIWLLISGCAAKQPEIIYVPERVELPAQLMVIPDKPLKPTGERTNEQMYFYRKELEQYTDKLRGLLGDIYFFLEAEKP